MWQEEGSALAGRRYRKAMYNDVCTYIWRKTNVQEERMIQLQNVWSVTTGHRDIREREIGLQGLAETDSP